MKKTFNEKCYEILRKVPKGKVTTYGEIAKKLRTKAYRQVGRAMNKNPRGFLNKGNVPCHRVVGSDGKLVGFAHGLKKKAEMLRKEGIEIEGNLGAPYTNPSFKNKKIDLKKYGFKFK